VFPDYSGADRPFFYALIQVSMDEIFDIETGMFIGAETIWSIVTISYTQNRGRINNIF